MTILQFYVSNYHSKKALSKAVSQRKTVKIKPLPLTASQLKENKEYSLSYGENADLPHKLPVPIPHHIYEIQGSFNKQVPIYFTTVMLNEHCNISSIV